MKNTKAWQNAFELARDNFEDLIKEPDSFGNEAREAIVEDFVWFCVDRNDFVGGSRVTTYCETCGQEKDMDDYGRVFCENCEQDYGTSSNGFYDDWSDESDDDYDEWQEYDYEYHQGYDDYEDSEPESIIKRLTNWIAKNQIKIANFLSRTKPNEMDDIPF